MASLRAQLDKGLDRWFAPIDPVILSAFETVFALTFLFYLSYELPYASEWLTDYGFHLTRETISGNYPRPAPLLPAEWMWPVVGGFLAILLAYIGGLWRRVLIWPVLVGALYAQMVDQPAAFTINRLYIVGFFFLAVGPRPKPGPDGQRVLSAWGVRIIQATLLLQYMGAGFCKIIAGDWLSRPDVLWTQSQGPFRTPAAGWALLELPMPVWWVMAYVGLLFEMFAPVLFLWRKTRLPTILYGVVFHLSIALLMKDLIYFSVQMIAFYALFLTPDEIRWPIRKLRSMLGRPAQA